MPKRSNVFERFKDSWRNKRRYVGIDKSCRFSPYADSVYKDVRDGIASRREKERERRRYLMARIFLAEAKAFPPIYRYPRYDIIFAVSNSRDQKRLVLFHRATVTPNKSVDAWTNRRFTSRSQLFGNNYDASQFSSDSVKLSIDYRTCLKSFWNFNFKLPNRNSQSDKIHRKYFRRFFKAKEINLK